MLRACSTYCWNVWGLTNYDFRLYAVDDGMLLDLHGVAAVVTEYGFPRPYNIPLCARSPSTTPTCSTSTGR